jgi:adenine deaminase
VTEALHRLKALAQAAGCVLEEPFLQLSFLALPVIPALKITDRGLVDVTTFQLVGTLL